MEWTFERATKETLHRFLNLYVYEYSVNKDGEKNRYPYFVASRHEAEKLLAVTRDFSRPDGVLIAAVKDRDSQDPQVLLITQFRPPLNAHIVEFPAGLLDEEDEDEVVAAKRESIEETGVELTNVRLLCPPSPTSSGLSDELVSIVEADVKSLSETHLERFEDIHAEFVPFSKVRALLDDPKTVIAVNVRLCLLYLLQKHGN